MTDWYYEENGGQRGPVSEGDLTAMLINRLLHPNTLVWTASLGSAWKPASQTHLEAAPQPVRPPPLPAATVAPPPLSKPTGGPTPLLGRQPHAAAQESGGPVPSSLTGKWAMWLAFTPLIFLAADIILASAGINPDGDSPQALGVMIWSGIATVWLAYMDAQAIKKSGRNPQRRTLVPFIFLFPIGYFIRRRIVAAAPLTPLWIWLTSAVVYVMGGAALAQ